MSEEDTVTTVWGAVKDRVKNPFTGAFILSFTLWNWKAISYYIFSKSDIENTITGIDKDYTTCIYIFYCIIFPLISACVIYFVLPHIYLKFDKWTLQVRKDRKDYSAKLAEHKLTQEKLEVSQSTIARLEKSGKELADSLKKMDGDYSSLQSKNITIKDALEKDNGVIATQKEEIKNLKVNVKDSLKHIEKIESIKDELELKLAKNETVDLHNLLHINMTDGLTEEEVYKFKKDFKVFKLSEVFNYFDKAGRAILSNDKRIINANSSVIEDLVKLGIIEVLIKNSQIERHIFTKRGKYYWHLHFLESGLGVSIEE